MNQEVEFINFSPERVIEVAVNILYGNDNEVLVVESGKRTGMFSGEFREERRE